MPINGSLKLNRLRSLGEPSPGGIAAIVFMLIRLDLPPRTLIKTRRRRERCPFAGNIDNIVMRLGEKDAEAWSRMLKSASLQDPELALAVSSWAQNRQKAKPRAATLGESHHSLGRWPASVGEENQEASPPPNTYNEDPIFIPPGNQHPSVQAVTRPQSIPNGSLSLLSPTWLGSEEG